MKYVAAVFVENEDRKIPTHTVIETVQVFMSYWYPFFFSYLDKTSTSYQLIFLIVLEGGILFLPIHPFRFRKSHDRETNDTMIDCR
jgi:hypothetical protein